MALPKAVVAAYVEKHDLGGALGAALQDVVNEQAEEPLLAIASKLVKLHADQQKAKAENMKPALKRSQTSALMQAQDTAYGEVPDAELGKSYDVVIIAWRA